MTASGQRTSVQLAIVYSPTLSARGSRYDPRTELAPNRRARYPSSWPSPEIGLSNLHRYRYRAGCACYPVRCPGGTYADESTAEMSLDHQTAPPQVPNHAFRKPTISSKGGAAKRAQSGAHRAMGGPDRRRATETAFGQLKTSLRLRLLTTPASCALFVSASARGLYRQ